MSASALLPVLSGFAYLWIAFGAALCLLASLSCLLSNWSWSVCRFRSSVRSSSIWAWANSDLGDWFLSSLRASLCIASISAICRSYLSFMSFRCSIFLNRVWFWGMLRPWLDGTLLLYGLSPESIFLCCYSCLWCTFREAWSATWSTRFC